MKRRAGMAWLFALGTLVGCGESLEPAPRVGDALPDLTFAMLDQVDSLAFADLEGRPALVNMWATWCPPCREEIPFFQALHEEFGPRGLRVVGVSSDNAGAFDQVEEFLGSAGVTYENLLDPRSQAMDAFRLFGLPATYLVDAEGQIALVRPAPVSERDTAFMATIEAIVSAAEGAR